MAEDGKILIVDDDDGQRALMEEMARSFGYDTESAADGFEALSEMKLGCDLVLLDAKMPGMDGFEVARRLREDGECSDVPIIMVTGLDNAEDRRRALEVGADDFAVIGQDLQRHQFGIVSEPGEFIVHRRFL